MISQVIFRYFNKKDAAINVLKDYEGMKKIIKTSKMKIMEKRGMMYSLGGLRMDGVPHSHNPHAGEERLINIIDDIDFLEERYKLAEEYMAWFTPAWEALNDEDRYLLSSFYFDSYEKGDNTAEGVAKDMCLCVQSVHNKKNKALEKFTALLFGAK